MIKVERQSIPDVLLITPMIHRDERGFFMESYNRSLFKESGINCDFVQDNQSFSSRGVLRGLHYQAPPWAQDKLVSVLSGQVCDVVVDIRAGSKTYGQHLCVSLDSETRQMLFVPKGFAHGFLVLSQEALFTYKVSCAYHPASENGLCWDDHTLNITWPMDKRQIKVVEKDTRYGAFKDLKSPF